MLSNIYRRTGEGANFIVSCEQLASLPVVLPCGIIHVLIFCGFFLVFDSVATIKKDIFQQLWEWILVLGIVVSQIM